MFFQKSQHTAECGGNFTWNTETQLNMVDLFTWEISKRKDVYIYQTVDSSFLLWLTISCSLIAGTFEGSIPLTKCHRMGGFQETIRPKCSSGLNWVTVLRDSGFSPPKSLTWNLKMDPWKRRFLLKTIISRFHVNLQGRTPKVHPMATNKSWQKKKQKAFLTLLRWQRKRRISKC